MPPVCSPTEIMEITIGGNTFDLASGAAMVSPPAIDARDCITALWMTMLPAVRAVISRPSRIDTPEEIRVPSVRVKRDTADLRSTSPSTGVLSSSVSICSRRVGQRLAALHVVHDLPRHVGQDLVLGLLRQDVEGLHQRQAGVDHGGELAGEHDDVARLDPAAELDVELELLGRGADLDDDHAILAQVGDDVV